MPDHMHGIIKIKRENAEVQYIEPLQHKYQKIIPKSIGSIIRSYKASVTRWCKKNQIEDFNYHERIITNQKELNNVRHYIKANPV
jgi:REP element-mobilizing transposase RayT